MCPCSRGSKSPIETWGTDAAKPMKIHESYLAAVGEALARRDVASIVEHIKEASVPLWMRVDGADLVLRSDDEASVFAVFDLLFIPSRVLLEGDGLHLAIHWLSREVEAGDARRLQHILSFVQALAALPEAPDDLFFVAVGVLAELTQQSGPTADWEEFNRTTRRFLDTHREIAPAKLADPRLLRAALWSGDSSLMRAFAEIGARHGSTPEQQMMVNYIISTLVSLSEGSTVRRQAEAMCSAKPRHPLAVHNLAQIYHDERRSVETIAELYDAIDGEAHPAMFRHTVNWIALLCHDEGSIDRAAGFFAMLSSEQEENAPQEASSQPKSFQVRTNAAMAVETRESYLAAIGEAIAKRDVASIVEHIKEASVPLWIRLDGADLVLRSDDDESVFAVFDQLFIPSRVLLEGDGLHLAIHWLSREVEDGDARRLHHILGFVQALAALPEAPDDLFFVAVGVLAELTQQSGPIARWAEFNRTTRRFLETYGQIAPAKLADPRLLRAALWSADFSLMRAFAEIGAKHGSTPEQRMMVNYIISSLVSFSDGTMVRPQAEAMYSAKPRHPLAVHNLAQIYNAECRSAENIAELYEAIDAQAHPGLFRQTVNWIARHCYGDGLIDRAASFFAMLSSVEEANAPKEVSWQLRSIQARAGYAPNDACAGGEEKLLNLDNLPLWLSAPLQQANDLAQADMSWTSTWTATRLQREFQRIAEHIATLRPDSLTLADCIRTTQELIHLSNEYFSPYQHYHNVSPVPPAEKYGRIDIERLRVSFAGLMAIARTIAGIGLEAILVGGPVTTLTQCLQPLDLFVTACLASGGFEDALVMIGRFESAVDNRDFALRHKERCLLAKGDVAELSAILPEAERDRSAVHAVIDREAWTQIEQVVWDGIFADPESTGDFEIAWPDGRLCRYSHEVPGVRLDRTYHNSLWLRRGEVICGQAGAVLRPKTFHYPIYYPEATPDILSQGKRCVRLLRLGPPVEIAEPVIVLENFDALYHRNFYHWVVLLLSRINYLKISGLLNGRRLIVPEGLTKWMHGSMQALGPPADEVLIAPFDKVLHLTDALLISSVEFASRTLLRSMCDRIPRRSTAPTEARYLYIGRRKQARRPLLNESEVEQMARDLGFAIVLPETLDFIAQAQLFQDAAGVAAPEGAALTNTLFCRPGARILSILSENDLFPTFTDLATIMGHSHRKLAGTPELDDKGCNFIWGPYRVDLELTERHLRWVLGTRE